jgi:hypothetical protein
MGNVIASSAHLKPDQPLFKFCPQSLGGFNPQQPEITGLVSLYVESPFLNLALSPDHV